MIEDQHETLANFTRVTMKKAILTTRKLNSGTKVNVVRATYGEACQDLYPVALEHYVKKSRPVHKLEVAPHREKLHYDRIKQTKTRKEKKSQNSSHSSRSKRTGR